MDRSVRNGCSSINRFPCAQVIGLKKGKTMRDELVTAAVFGDQTQAVVVRMHLEEAGIPAFLLDEFMSQGLFVIGGATGGLWLPGPGPPPGEALPLINDRLPEHAASVDWSAVDVGQPEPEHDAIDGEHPPETNSEAAS